MVRYDPLATFPPPGTESSCRRALEVDGEVWGLSIEDLSTTPLRLKEPGFRADIFEARLMNADGVILLYDITSKKSYEHVAEEGYGFMEKCRKPSRADASDEIFSVAQQRFGCVLVGNKLDLAECERGEQTRQVTSEVAAEWGRMRGIKSFEVDYSDQRKLEDVMRALVRSIKSAQNNDTGDLRIKTVGAAADTNPTAQLQVSRSTNLSFSKIRNAFPRILPKSKPSS